MNENEILDTGYFSEDKKEILGLIRWWERRRILYNLILIGVEGLALTFYSEETLLFGIYMAIFWSLLYTIVANIVYSLGWGSELLLEYYIGNYSAKESNKIVLWRIGVLFSICLTWFLYRGALS